MADRRLTPHACSKRIRRKPAAAAAAADQKSKRHKRNIQQQINAEDDGHRLRLGRYLRSLHLRLRLQILLPLPTTLNSKERLLARSNSPSLLLPLIRRTVGSCCMSYRHLSITCGRPSQLILIRRHKIYAITFSARIVIIDVLFDLPILEFLPEGCPRMLFFNVGPFITEFDGQLLFLQCDPLMRLSESKSIGCRSTAW